MSFKIERVIAAVLVLCLAAAGTGLAFELRRLYDGPGPRPAAIRRPVPRPSLTPTPPSPSPPSTPAAPGLEPKPETDCAFPAGSALDPLDDSGATPRAQIAAIARRVETLRGLRFDHDVTPVFEDSDEMAHELTTKLLNGYTRTEADEDKRILSALGAVPSTLNLRHVAAKGLGGDVLGYYVPKTEKLLVQKSEDGTLGAAQEFILSHELEHALADQDLDLPKTNSSNPSDADRGAAREALVEGDATITMLQFATTSLTDSERLSLATDPALSGSSSLADAPYFVRKTFEFPYDAGAKFVCALYLDGGWKEVDRAYAHPPVSSAQILFPQRYLDRDRPRDPRDPRPPSPRWANHPTESLGAADLLWLLGAPGGDPAHAPDDPLERVAAWDGGEAHLFTKGRDSAVSMDLLARPGSTGLCVSVDAWYRVSFPVDQGFRRKPHERFAYRSKGQAAVLRCDRGDVRLGIAPTLPAARAVAR